MRNMTKTLGNLSSEERSVRVWFTSKQEGFAAVVKPRDLANSIGGVCQVKFMDDINLVVLVRPESQSWWERTRLEDTLSADTARVRQTDQTGVCGAAG